MVSIKSLNIEPTSALADVGSAVSKKGLILRKNTYMYYVLTKTYMYKFDFKLPNYLRS